MRRPPQYRAALVGRSLAEAQWVTTPPQLRSYKWVPSHQIVSTLRMLRQHRDSEAVVAHAEERGRELTLADKRRRARADTLMSN